MLFRSLPTEWRRRESNPRKISTGSLGMQRDNAPVGQCSGMPLERDSRQKLLKPLECLRPARLVQRVSSLGRERPLVENELRSLAMLEERERHHRLLVVGIRLFPFERVHEAPRRIDLGKLAAEVERLSLRRLHRDAVPPSVANVEVDAGSGEASRTPPLSELLRLDARCEHALGWRLQDLLQMKAKGTGVACHAGDYASVQPEVQLGSTPSRALAHLVHLRQ